MRGASSSPAIILPGAVSAPAAMVTGHFTLRSRPNVRRPTSHTSVYIRASTFGVHFSSTVPSAPKYQHIC